MPEIITGRAYILDIEEINMLFSMFFNTGVKINLQLPALSFLEKVLVTLSVTFAI